LNDDIARTCIEDAEGDSLDAVLAGIQAVWAWMRREATYGVPCDCDPGEGWIVDPLTQPSVNSSITRVRPVFQRLLAKDPTGASWLPSILKLSTGNATAERMLTSTGTLLAGVVEKRLYKDRLQWDLHLEAAFEHPVPPSAEFLQFLFNNPASLTCVTRQNMTDPEMGDRPDPDSKTR
jgi:hypothetical protein